MSGPIATSVAGVDTLLAIRVECGNGELAMITVQFVHEEIPCAPAVRLSTGSVILQAPIATAFDVDSNIAWVLDSLPAPGQLIRVPPLTAAARGLHSRSRHP